MLTDSREAVRRKILAAGFDVVRFAPAGLVEARFRERFAHWLATGQHATMEWLARNPEKRTDPDQVLPGALTVIACGVNYWRADDQNSPGQPAIARYAWYEDYHDKMGKALRQAGHEVVGMLGLGADDFRSYVDTGPVMERGWAVRAGLGFQGKNGMLISRRFGNWLLLGVILLRASLPPDTGMDGVSPRRPVATETDSSLPVGALCGKCTRCQTACPTNAIPTPGLVDARRCLSFHTIENRGSIPVELRRPLGRRIFGCDDCLAVCPWNRFAAEARSQLLTYRPLITGLSVVDFLRLDRERYQEIFRRSPLKRPKLEGLLRNAAVVAGNILRETQSPAERDSLLAALHDLADHPSPIVREHVLWALTQSPV